MHTTIWNNKQTLVFSMALFTHTYSMLLYWKKKSEKKMSTYYIPYVINKIEVLMYINKLSTVICN